MCSQDPSDKRVAAKDAGRRYPIKTHSTTCYKFIGQQDLPIKSRQMAFSLRGQRHWDFVERNIKHLPKPCYPKTALKSFKLAKLGNRTKFSHSLLKG